MGHAVWEFPLLLPRHAFSPRDAARAGDVWRCFQEIAVEASTRAGWPPDRYRAAGTAFLVRGVTVRHYREVSYGEQTQARTWVTNFRRDTFSARELRLLAGDQLIARATQDWVHVSVELKPLRAGPELLAAFPSHSDDDGATELPVVARGEGPTHAFEFECWHTWMDPLAHVNHPAYVDWCDEATSRRLADAGLSPVALRPVAERLTFRSGAVAGDRIRVLSQRVGRTEDGAVAIAHRIERADGGLCAEGQSIRTLAGADPGRLWDALG